MLVRLLFGLGPYLSTEIKYLYGLALGFEDQVFGLGIRLVTLVLVRVFRLKPSQLMNSLDYDICTCSIQVESERLKRYVSFIHTKQHYFPVRCNAFDMECVQN